MGTICGDNRFEIIKKAKEELLFSTNIDTAEDEMKVIDSFLFRCWQMGWLERYDKPREPLDIPTMTTDFIKEHGLPCPNDYEFRDENGNVIEAKKIVLEKKKPKYPQSYEECLSVLGIYNGLPDVEIYNAKPSECKLFESLIRLKRCRDAYWKIAGEEMGLDGPWEPNFASCKTKYAITYYNNVVSRYSEVGYENTMLVFPTEEMRDAFYEAFKGLIEECKELL